MAHGYTLDTLCWYKPLSWYSHLVFPQNLRNQTETLMKICSPLYWELMISGCPCIQWILQKCRCDVGVTLMAFEPIGMSEYTPKNAQRWTRVKLDQYLSPLSCSSSGHKVGCFTPPIAHLVSVSVLSNMPTRTLIWNDNMAGGLWPSFSLKKIKKEVTEAGSFTAAPCSENYDCIVALRPWKSSGYGWHVTIQFWIAL